MKRKEDISSQGELTTSCSSHVLPSDMQREYPPNIYSRELYDMMRGLPVYPPRFPMPKGSPFTDVVLSIDDIYVKVVNHLESVEDLLNLATVTKSSMTMFESINLDRFQYWFIRKFYGCARDIENALSRNACIPRNGYVAYLGNMIEKMELEDEQSEGNKKWRERPKRNLFRIRTIVQTQLIKSWPNFNAVPLLKYLYPYFKRILGVSNLSDEEVGLIMAIPNEKDRYQEIIKIVKEYTEYLPKNILCRHLLTVNEDGYVIPFHLQTGPNQFRQNADVCRVNYRNPTPEWMRHPERYRNNFSRRKEDPEEYFLEYVNNHEEVVYVVTDEFDDLKDTLSMPRDDLHNVYLMAHYTEREEGGDYRCLRYI
jgi:hypothetical protein